MLKKYIPALSLFFVSNISLSNEPHIHGLAYLTLALEDNVLIIEFESPAGNLVGFEHKAESKLETQKVIQTKKILTSAHELFSFNGTVCKSEQIHIDVSSLLPHEDNDHDTYLHESHSHESHRHKTHNQESHDHKTHKHQENSHAEITARYQFNCNKSSSPSSISFNALNQFPNLQAVNANWITETSQGSQSLTKHQYQINLQ